MTAVTRVHNWLRAEDWGQWFHQESRPVFLTYSLGWWQGRTWCMHLGLCGVHTLSLFYRHKLLRGSTQRQLVPGQTCRTKWNSSTLRLWESCVYRLGEFSDCTIVNDMLLGVWGHRDLCCGYVLVFVWVEIVTTRS